MNEVSLQVDSVSKAFSLYSSPATRLRQLLLPAESGRQFQALHEVSFCVRRGEAVAIIGRNGSGKSTLLQIIAGTLQASSGSVTTTGRVSALLELGAGFNPEYSGRENIHLNGRLLGMSAEALAQRFEQIVDFSELREFLEQPIKTYSSGMIVRLAFAIAAHTEPEIFVVDEALAVGDEAFQRKCIGLIQRMREAGTTLLFVSHSAQSVVELCDRALLLDGGELIDDGEPKRVIGNYQRLLYAQDERRPAIRAAIRAGTVPAAESSFAGDSHVQASTQRDVPVDPAWYLEALRAATQAYPEHGARIECPRLLNADGHQVNILRRGHTYYYQYRVLLLDSARDLRFGCMVRNLNGIELAGVVSHREGEGVTLEGGKTYWVTLPFCCRFNPGTYFLNAGVVARVGDEERYLHRLLDALMFKVVADERNRGTGLFDITVATAPAISELPAAD